MQQSQKSSKQVKTAQEELAKALHAVAEVERVTGQPLDVMLRPKVTALIEGCSQSTLYRRVRAGTFPAPFKLSPDGDAVAFSAREVAEVQAERKGDRVWTGNIGGKLGRPKSDSEEPAPKATALLDATEVKGLLGNRSPT